MNIKTTNPLNGGVNATNVQRQVTSQLATNQSSSAQSQANALAQKYGFTLPSTYKPQTMTATTTTTPKTTTTAPISNPVTAKPVTATPASSSYTIAKGDTLWGLANKYATTVANLQKLNPNLNANALQIGSKINVSGSSAPTSTAPAKSTTPATPATSSYSVSSGDTLTAIAKKYGTTVANLTKLNPGINPNMLKIGQKINVTGSASGTPTAGGGVVLPKDYGTLMTPQQIMDYAKSQASNKFQNEQLGYQQMIDQYNRQIGQLSTDALIEEQAKRMSDMKYADAFTGLDKTKNTAQSEYEGSLQNLRNQYNDGTGQVHNNAFQQRQKSLEEMYARGLGHSTVLDQRTGMIDKSETEGITKLTADLNNNVASLDREIGTLMTNLELDRANLTKQQQSDLVSAIQEKVIARDQEKSRLQQLVDQQNQLINQARTNQTANQNDMYNDLFQQYADLFRQDRDFAEDKRRFELEYALKKQAGSGGGGGGSSYRSSGGSSSRGSSGSSSKSSSSSSSSRSSSGSYSRATADAIAKASGNVTPSKKESLGMGPISDAYYKAAMNAAKPKSPSSALLNKKAPAKSKSVLNPLGR